MKIVLTSDIHGFLPDIPSCDLLLIAGDVCPVHDHDRKFQADWLRNEFTDWMRAQPARSTVWIGGNHDLVLEDWRGKREKLAQLPGVYLDNADITVPIDECTSLKIWGSPMSNTFGRWAFMASENILAEVWRSIPRDTDIILTHGPPWGLGDLVPAYSWSAHKRGWITPRTGGGDHVGSSSLTNQLSYDRWPNLKLLVTGHIHEAFGKYELNGFDIWNAAHVTADYPNYKPVNPPVEITL